MNFSCERNLLTKGLQLASRATDSKSNIAVLKNVLLDLEADKLNIIGFDHRIGIRTTIPCSASTMGKTTVPYGLMVEILNVMQDSTVHIFNEGNVLRLECGRSRYSVNCVSAEDFPPFPAIDDARAFKIPREILETGLRQTYFATSVDDPRAFMNGVFVKKEYEKMVFVGTDGHRLAVRYFSLPATVSVPDFSLIAPTKAINELLRVLGDSGQDTVKITVGDKYIAFTVGENFVISRLIDANYPKFEKVIPESSSGSCRMSKAKLAGAVRGAAIMATGRENKGIIEISITDNAIMLSANTQDVGSAVEEIEAVKKGKDIRVAYNSRYIIDFLNTIDDDEIVFEYNEELNPGFFHTDAPDYKYVLMPIKI